MGKAGRCRSQIVPIDVYLQGLDVRLVSDCVVKSPPTDRYGSSYGGVGRRGIDSNRWWFRRRIGDGPGATEFPWIVCAHRSRIEFFATRKRGFEVDWHVPIQLPQVDVETGPGVQQIEQALIVMFDAITGCIPTSAGVPRIRAGIHKSICRIVLEQAEDSISALRLIKQVTGVDVRSQLSTIGLLQRSIARTLCKWDRTSRMERGPRIQEEPSKLCNAEVDRQRNRSRIIPMPNHCNSESGSASSRQ